MPVNQNELSTQQTPFLLIDHARFMRNLTYLQQRISERGCALRPHLKTLRSVDAAHDMLPNMNSPATVSTLAEAEAFADAGYTDLLYALGITSNKLERAAALIKRGINFHILLDSLEQAQAVTQFGQQHDVVFSVFIEIDSDGHRAGLAPNNPLIIEIAQHVHANDAQLTGVMTHAGGSYSSDSVDEIRAAAAQECEAARNAAEAIRATGVPCPIVSVGSTPTAHFAEEFIGISEVRAGVYTTFDLVMLNLGVCSLDDIAMSVVTTVIGHNKEKNWVLIDAGWMALSRDRGTASQRIDYGYGLVCKDSGAPYEGVCVTSVNQEHGVIALPATHTVDEFPIGAQLRILPNHACATAAMHQHYMVLKNTDEIEVWPRILGW